MPRGPRERIEGAFYHVYSRGNRRQTVFVDDADRRRFLRRLRTVEAATGAVRIAHCLMPNHFHLLIRPGAGGISRLMHRVLGLYATGFNRRHAAVGHLFQGRFGSRPLLSPDDVLIVLRYIHHNPLKAGFVEALADWEWSSHGAYLMDPPPPELALGVHIVRGFLCRSRRDRNRAAAAYRQLMDEPAPRDDEVFPSPASRKPRAHADDRPVVPEHWKTPSIEAVARAVASRSSIPLSELLGTCVRRDVVRARRTLIHLAVRRWGHPAGAVAEALHCSAQVVYRHLAKPSASGGGRRGRAVAAGRGVPPGLRMADLPGTR